MKLALVTVAIIVGGMVVSYLWLCWEQARSYTRRRGYASE